MVLPQRGSGVGVRRWALIAACAFVACVTGDRPYVAKAEPAAATGAERGDVGAEQRAEEIYLDGVQKLEAGNADFARVAFESVIAQYPLTHAASDAQRQLGELYAAAGIAGAAAPAMVTGSIDAPGLGDVGVPAEVPMVRAPLWDKELRRNASIQSKLRLDAGDRVFFAAGSAELGSRARNALAAQAQWLKRWREFEAAIEGHADEPGTEQENVVLSLLRAEAVRERLIEEGVDPSRLTVVPLGRSVRVATCADTDCRSQNRRAVTLVFASGTRERLGLVISAPLGMPAQATALAAPLPAADPAPGAPAAH
jgi:outer membrane protein OmpA-like peptidoglycan-associated protein